MQDLPERPQRRATRRGNTKAASSAAEDASGALWAFAPELEAYMARAATRSAPLQDMLIFAWRGDE